MFISKTFFDNFRNKPIKKWVLFVIFVSFIIKLIIGYAIRESFFRRGNSHTPLNNIALNLRENWEFAIEPGIPSVDYEPIYPLILGLSYKIFGSNWFGVTLIQAILYGITSWLLFLIGMKVKDEITGFVGATYHSFYPYLFFHSLSVFDTTQYIFVIVLLVYVVITMKERKRIYWQYCFFGGLLGFSLLSRGSAIAFWPPIILYLLLKNSHLNFLKKFIFVLIGMMVILSPWLIRNYVYAGTFLISAHGGFGFWQGNNEFSYQYLKNNISLDEVYRRNPPPEIYKEFPLMARPPKETISVSKAYTSEAIRFIKENPKTFLKLWGLKFVKFWSWIRNPITQEYEFGSKHLRQLIYFLSYIPLLIFLPAGVCLLLKRSFVNFLLLFGMLVTYTLAHMIVIGFTRARLPLDFILMIFFGVVTTSLVKKNSFEKFNV